MIHENKYISFLFLFYFILFYFETYVQGLPEEYVEKTSLQILQLPKKRDIFRELNPCAKGIRLHSEPCIR